jgi:predicted ATPase
VRTALIAERERIVTLTGRGGSGKTTLALTAAAELLDEFAGGVWLVRLATVASPTRIGDAIASAIGAVAEAERTASAAIIARLRGRGRTLLVLDNLEHLIDGAADIATLVAGLPDVQILATSQAPLRLADEICLPLDALDDDASLALVERVARRRNPAVTVSGRDRAELLELVQLLDGLPLALEVAAARLALLSPAQLLRRLRDSPDILRDDRSDRPERQRSLRATIDWSLSLLEPPARALFARLGAFAGPVELEELEAICGADGLDVVGELFRLLEVALIRRVESGDRRIRFGLPEGLRRIAADELDRSADGERWRRAHAERQHQVAWPVRDFFATRGEYDAALVAGPERLAALGWSQTGAPQLHAALAACHGMLASERGAAREALTVLEPLVAALPDDRELAAVACCAMSLTRFSQGHTEEGFEQAERALELAPTQRLRIAALICRGLLHGLLGRSEQAVADSAAAVELADGEDPAAHAVAITFEAQARLFLDDAAGGRALLDRFATELATSDVSFLWRRFTVEGDIAAAMGRYDEALGFYVVSLEAARRRGHDGQQIFDIVGTALALAALGEDATAVELVAMARAFAVEAGGPTASLLHVLDLGAIEAAQRRLGSEATAAAQARGAAVASDPRVPRACTLARAAAGAGPAGATDAISPAAG